MTVSKDEQVDVVVAGAGPCGLACALAIKATNPGLTVRVLERSRQMRPCGGNIGISSANTMTALGAIGPGVLEAFKGARVHRPKLTTGNKDGGDRLTREIEAYNVSWYDMQQALLSQLPEGTVQVASAVKTVRTSHLALPLGPLVRERGPTPPA